MGVLRFGDSEDGALLGVNEPGRVLRKITSLILSLLNVT